MQTTYGSQCPAESNIKFCQETRCTVRKFIERWVFLTVSIFSLPSRSQQQTYWHVKHGTEAFRPTSFTRTPATMHFVWLSFGLARRPLRHEGWGLLLKVSNSYCIAASGDQSTWKASNRTINHARNKPTPNELKKYAIQISLTYRYIELQKITSTVNSCILRPKHTLSSHTSTKQQLLHTWSIESHKPKVPRTSCVHKTRTISNSARKINKRLR